MNGMLSQYGICAALLAQTTNLIWLLIILLNDNDGLSTPGTPGISNQLFACCGIYFIYCIRKHERFRCMGVTNWVLLIKIFDEKLAIKKCTKNISNYLGATIIEGQKEYIYILEKDTDNDGLLTLFLRGDKLHCWDFCLIFRL